MSHAKLIRVAYELKEETEKDISPKSLHRMRKLLSEASDLLDILGGPRSKT